MLLNCLPKKSEVKRGSIRFLKAKLYRIVAFSLLLPALLPALTIVDAHTLRSTLRTPLSIEHANTAETLAWGLMQRRSLPSHHAMLFHYPHPQWLSFWSFNCLMDLDVAFLDKHKVIREIHLLKAYPEHMDPNRPVRSLQDFKRYPPFDPVIHFFQQRAVKSKRPAQYVLETTAGWFHKQDIQSGDLLFEDREVIHSIDVSSLSLPVHLRFPSTGPWALWQARGKQRLQVTERDSQGVVQGKWLLPPQKPGKQPSVYLTKQLSTEVWLEASP